MNGSAALSLQDLAIGFGKPLAQNINLEIREREFVTIMGENGSGKSTLLDCLVGNLQPLHGQIRFWGLENRGSDRSLVNRKTGWVISQQENHPFFLSVEGLFRTISPLYPRWDWDLCRQLCKIFELDSSKRLFHLSLGEQSKIRLIKALSFRPSLVILDELTANLSPNSKQSLLAALLDLFSKEEMAVLYVCHFKEEAIRLSDRIYDLSASGLRLTGGQNV